MKTTQCEYKVEQTIAHKLRQDLKNQYIRKRAKDQKVSPKVMKKMMSREEDSREIGRISKNIHERNIRYLVIKATVT